MSGVPEGGAGCKYLKRVNVTSKSIYCKWRNRGWVSETLCQYCREKKVEGDNLTKWVLK